MSIKQFILVAFVGIALASCTTQANEEKIDNKLPNKITQAIPVEVFKPAYKMQQGEIQASGKFTADNEKFLSFKIGGVISSILVNKGDKVSEGQLLAILNKTEINAQVVQAKEGLIKAERDFKRVSNLFADSVATLEQKQNAATGLEVAKKQVEIAEFNARFAEIRATENGYVLMKMSEEGQVTSPGAPVLQVGGNTNQSGKWLLSVGVSDKEWSLIQKGDTAEIRSDAFNGKSYLAKVTRKGRSLNPSTATFDIDLELIERPENIATGLFAKAVIKPSEKSMLWEIPYESLLDGDNNKGYVFVTTDKQKAHFQEVKIHSLTGTTVLISEGLSKEMLVVSSGSAYLKDGGLISILK